MDIQKAFEHGQKVGRSRLMLSDIPQGVDRDSLKAGDVVMISINRLTGDGSWTDEPWTVVGLVGARVIMKAIREKHWLGGKPISVWIEEHEFYDASAIAEAFATPASDA